MAAGGERIVELDRLRAILDAYGADPARWPEPEREGALRLLARSPEAAKHRDRARELDALLDRATAYEPAPGLLARVLARPGRRRASLFEELWPFGPIWRPAFGMAAAMVLGVAVGLVAPPPFVNGAAADISLGDDIDALAFGPELESEDGE